MVVEDLHAEILIQRSDISVKAMLISFKCMPQTPSLLCSLTLFGVSCQHNFSMVLIVVLQTQFFIVPPQKKVF